ncbi:MAG: hypothetical protein Q4G10_04100 [Bacteroidia bacterium]|nr:hypothetical protein [Bacteroidia bacterium]
MVKCRKSIGVILIAVYAFFFASTNFFYHSHQLADSRLVHSHPFSSANHSHTANQIVLINILDSAVYEESTAIAAPDIIPARQHVEISKPTVEPVLDGSFIHFSLRAPPAVC